VGHITSVYFLPYVKSLKNLINTAFDWKNYTATSVGSVTVLVSVVVILLAWIRAKPYKKYRIPWNIWKSLHYLLYVGYFAICAHAIEAAKEFSN
jgi:predicted ferric reductase